MIRTRAIDYIITVIGVLVSCSPNSSAQERSEHSLTSNVVKPKPAYPEFTWDRIPLYMHIRKATSYTDEEIAFLAKFPLITFEKANGHQDHGSVEVGTLKSARAVKEINPSTTILYYRNVMVHYGGACERPIRRRGACGAHLPAGHLPDLRREAQLFPHPRGVRG